VEFGSYLRSSGANEKDIADKSSQVSKLLKYLSSLQTVTSDEPPTAEVKLLCNTVDHGLLQPAQPAADQHQGERNEEGAQRCAALVITCLISIMLVVIVQ